MTDGPNNLRPQTVGGLLDTTFRMYRKYFLPLLILTVCIYLPYLILQSIFDIHTQALFSSLAQNVQDPNVISKQLVGQIPNLSIAFGFMVLSAFIVSPLLYGSILHMDVNIQVDGQQNPRTWQDFRHALRRLVPTILTNIVRWILFFVASAVAGGIVVGIGVLFGSLGLTTAAVSVAVTLVGLTMAVILIWLAVKLALTSSVVMEENISYFKAIRRSFELTRGNMWRIIGYFIVVQLLIFVVSAGFGLLFSLVPQVVFESILTDLIGVLVAPFSYLATANLYLDLKVRTEAPDLAAWLRDE